MVSEVRFFSAPYSRPNRSFPIGDLTKYLVHTIADMKTSPDMEQILHVPEFDNWDTVNLVQVMDTSYVYWVRASTKRTDKKGQIVFDLLFNAVTSLITEGDELKGVWDRLPTNENPYLKEVINTDAMKVTRKVDINKLPSTGRQSEFQACWYEIVMRQEIDTTGKESLIRYGGFATIPLSAANGYYDAQLVANGLKTTTSKMYAYPPLNILINNFNLIAPKASADKIVSLNVSLRCPFKTVVRDLGEFELDLVYGANNTKVEPEVFSDYSVNDNVTWVLYALEKIETTPNEYEVVQTISCTDNERKYGSFNIVNEGGITIGEIPSEYFKNNELNIKVTCTSDYTGIYTNLEFNEGIIRIPEGKLPWVGDSWTDYQVRSMDRDRESLELSIENAREQRNIDAMMSLSNAGMSGAMGYAMSGTPMGLGLGLLTAGVGIAGSHMQGELSARTARTEQEITERYQKQQLSNHFDTSYGMIYLLDYNVRALQVTVSMPMNLTEEVIDEHVKEFGYRVEGVRSIEVQNGRYQGRLIDIPVPGPKGDMLNAEFIEGVKIGVVEEPPEDSS